MAFCDFYIQFLLNHNLYIYTWSVLEKSYAPGARGYQKQDLGTHIVSLRSPTGNLKYTQQHTCTTVLYTCNALCYVIDQCFSCSHGGRIEWPQTLHKKIFLMKPCVEKRRHRMEKKHSTVYKEHTYIVHNAYVATTIKTRVSKRMVWTYDVHSRQKWGSQACVLRWILSYTVVAILRWKHDHAIFLYACVPGGIRDFWISAGR